MGKRKDAHQPLYFCHLKSALKGVRKVREADILKIAQRFIAGKAIKTVRVPKGTTELLFDDKSFVPCGT